MLKRREHTPTNGAIPRPPRRKPVRQGSGRLYVVGAAIFLGMLGLVGRLFMLQVVEGETYAEMARKQYESKAPLQADRGAIYDRNGVLLATNVMATSYAVDPKHVENPKKLAQAFADAFGGDPKDYLKSIAKRDKSFVWIKRKVLGESTARMKRVDDEGLIVLSEPVRRFEHGRLGAQVVGCTNLDNAGLGGVELFYDELLQGEDGYVVMQRDATGRRRHDIDLPRSEPVHGENLQLTIDINVQGIVEDELMRGVKQADAESGTVIALDPNTGEILAMAGWPTFDPNDPAAAAEGALRNRGITDAFEPGSTMKAITAAAALEEGMIAPDDMVDAEGGELTLPDGHVIRDDHPLGTISIREAVRWSSNVVFAKVARQLPEGTLYRYARDFGFGISTGIDLPGEARGEVKKPAEFSEETPEFMAFGYQLAVTPLQLVTAYAAIANGGSIVRPHVLRKRLNGEGDVVEETEPQEVRRVISEETADALREMLVDVVDNGTGQAARVSGIKVAGKTGTAQQLFEGTYSKGKYNASFVGFFPAENPKMVLLVLIQNPKNGYYGGQVAAPIFSGIARRIVNATMSNEEPGIRRVALESPESVSDSVADAASSIAVLDLRGLSLGEARRLALLHGLRTVANGDGRRVTAQQPPPGSRVTRGGAIVLTMGEADGTMPDLRGMSVRRALTILNAHRLEPTITGSSAGIVRTQSPAPGTRIGGKRRVRIESR